MTILFSNRALRRRKGFWIPIIVFSIVPLICDAIEGMDLLSEGHTAIAAGHPGKIRAPELDGGLGWLNVDKPLRLSELRGKIVLLDFWTYCCINCMHIIPDLKKLEKKYSNELVVIGVHSAKFLNEKETGNIREAILRYEIEHPVVNDANFQIWRAYGARGWPHLALIDPEGNLAGETSGEGNCELLDNAIQQLTLKFAGKINRAPLSLSLEKNKQPPALLSFPGKVLADEASDRILIADSNHNRIAIADLRGQVIDIAGTGTVGRADGSFETSEFHHPQGMAILKNIVYVADTENHLLRRLDLQKRTVATVAGTGKQAFGRTRGGAALRVALNSPWDLLLFLNKSLHDFHVYLAMAGSHQIWVYNPSDETVKPYAGTGREDLLNGPLDASALAQPSGLTSDGYNLFFADSEVSALRWIDRNEGTGWVKTLIGSGLFDFGDRDGDFDQALLQHPLGVQYHDGKVYIADTYNHKIKVADLQSRIIQTLAGNGKPGIGIPGAPQFNEPSGLSLAGNILYIADTNNHAIRTLDLKTKQVDTLSLDISDWERKKPSDRLDVFGKPDEINLTDQKFSLGGSARIVFQMNPQDRLNPAIQPIVQLQVSGEGKDWIGPKFHPEVSDNTIQFKLTSGSIEKPEKVMISITYYYCREDQQGQCRIGSLLISGLAQKGDETLTLTHTIP